MNKIGLIGLGNSTYQKANKSFTYKQYYVEVILKEIGIIGRGNNTYCKANKSCICKRYCFEMIFNEKASLNMEITLLKR